MRLKSDFLIPHIRIMNHCIDYITSAIAIKYVLMKNVMPFCSSHYGLEVEKTCQNSNPFEVMFF